VFDTLTFQERVVLQDRPDLGSTSSRLTGVDGLNAVDWRLSPRDSGRLEKSIVFVRNPATLGDSKQLGEMQFLLNVTSSIADSPAKQYAGLVHASRRHSHIGKVPKFVLHVRDINSPLSSMLARMQVVKDARFVAVIIERTGNDSNYCNR
jgi:hypothetical protein